jgi:hypothetical protein
MAGPLTKRMENDEKANDRLFNGEEHNLITQEMSDMTKAAATLPCSQAKSWQHCDTLRWLISQERRNANTYRQHTW